MQNKLIIGKLAAVALFAALSAGCATKGYVNEQVAQAKSAADAAQATANQAAAKANTAGQQASEALAAAQAAQQCCVDTNEKIDRMFKQSMLK
ncbi:Lpp/OprI family alanine-zipper lipoprotein [Immundisolibacter sp.]|uniref:Lpp/OprI family alanine-zipper lipoprotein n=1 Tax=Immundisolibacter sp. TaxID=1934948 RepID=UPI00356639CB